MARRRRKKGGHAPEKHAAALVALFAAFLLVAGVAYVSLRGPAKPQIPAGQPVAFVVPKGATTKQIAESLEQKGIVADANSFRKAARSAAVDDQLKAGTFEMVTGMQDAEVIAVLTAGPPDKSTTVTIPEGFTVKQIAARMAKETGIPQDEFLRLAETGAAQFAGDHPYLKNAYNGSLQGYLFPKTYRIKEGATAAEVIEMMLDQFDKETESLDLRFAKSRGLDLNEVVIAASIIEREAKVARERPLVSSVIYNRLKIGMRLQMCSTVQYILGTTRFRLTNKDIATPSPYNTYIHDGLPPGPIANPGAASLEAAAKPADTRYIYYVLTGKDGSQTFATNAKDFARAQQKSLEVFGQ